MNTCPHCKAEFNDIDFRNHNWKGCPCQKAGPDQTMKKDAGKPRWELLPFECIEGMVNVLTFGANKYEDGGWKQLMVNEEGYQRIIGSLRRHQLAIERDGILALDLNEFGDTDADHSGLPHIDHIQCCVMFIKYYQLHLAKEMGEPIFDKSTLPCDAWERCMDYTAICCFVANNMMDHGLPCFSPPVDA